MWKDVLDKDMRGGNADRALDRTILFTKEVAASVVA